MFFYTLFYREISKHKLTIVHICMAKFYTPNCPEKWALNIELRKIENNNGFRLVITPVPHVVTQ